MTNPTVVAVGENYRLFGDSVTTHDILPAYTYTVEFSDLTGYSLKRTEPLAAGEEKIYGNHGDRVRRIVRSYEAMDRSLGVILSGDKGMGKSLMLRMVAEAMRHEHELPTIIVRHNTPGIASFIDEIGEAVIVFDEFEKVFTADHKGDEQSQFLSLFDGMSTAKRLYILSVNNLDNLNDFMKNRPGRFHYHMRFTYPEADMIRTYVRDQAPDTSEKNIEDIVNFSRRFDLTFDHLRAIAFELNLGEDFLDGVGDLNIKRSQHHGSSSEVVVLLKDGRTVTFSGYFDLFDEQRPVQLYDRISGLEIQFRLLGAVESDEGLVLDPANVKVTLDEDDVLDNIIGDGDGGTNVFQVVSALVKRKHVNYDFRAL